MCGITGIVRFDGQAVDPSTVAAMVASIKHRGPDDSGVFVEGNFGMGMSRLAIIDLSPLGHQPMGNEDGKVQVVYNGEVYNFEDLRVRLGALGHTFRGRSDTEVLVHGYEEYGAVELAKQLEGMFAAAIFDRRRKQLHLVRGPFGIKPLYLRRTSKQLSFASELRALSHDGQGAPSAASDWIGGYLRLGYVPAPKTAFQDVTRLEPGTVLSIDLITGEEKRVRYYRLRPRVIHDATPSELLMELNKLLGMTVRRQMVADVPVGIFLSGGLDSSIIAAMAARRSTREVRTFSMGFKDSDRGDETEAASNVARAIGAENDILRIDPTDLAGLDQIVASLEEPLADSAVVPLWQLCRATAKHVKVALSGEGGDEALGGYPRYFWGVVNDRIGTLPPMFADALSATKRLVPGRSKGPLNVLRRAAKLAETSTMSESERYLSWFDIFTPAERHALAPEAEDSAASAYEALFAEAHQAGLDPLQRMQFVDINTMLVDNLLAKSDRLSMAHSLEVRVPMLDKQLLEFGLALPTSAKVSPIGSKILLRRLVRSEISVEAAVKPKRGFEIPVDHWFRHGAARSMSHELASGPLTRSLGLQSEAIDSLVRRHEAGEDLGRKLFALLMLEFWARRYV